VGWKVGGVAALGVGVGEKYKWQLIKNYNLTEWKQ